MISETIASLTIFLLVFASAFALYLPLCAITKDRLIGLRYAIPFSISVEVIIGYVFYCTNSVKYFPIAYLTTAILANVWGYFKLKPIVIHKPKIDIPTGLSLLVVFIAIVYTRYFDAFKFVGPGGNDTSAHVKFIKDLFEIGRLSNGYYAPGFHLFLMPIAKVISLSYLYRFAGPAIGMITVVSLVLLTKDYLKNKVLLIFLLALLSLPIFNQFTLQTISFFSSSLTFIFFTSFILLLATDNNKQRKNSVYLFLIFCSALALTVPYLFIGLIPSFFLLLIVASIFKRHFKTDYFRYLFKLFLILLIGFVFSFGHIFIQSKILHRYTGFPNIPVASSGDDEDQEPDTNNELVKQYKLPLFIMQNELLRPMLGTGLDLVRVKNLRPANNILSIGAYLWIILSFFVLIYAINNKNPTLLAIATFSIFFGLCTQTGVFEMSYYRGRSGWYLLLLSILGTTIFLDELNLRKFSKWLMAGCIIISATGFIFPPKFYRAYYDEEFRVIRQIAGLYSNTTISLVTGHRQLKIVAPNIKILSLDHENLTAKNAFLIIEKKMFRPNAILSQSTVLGNRNLTEFNDRWDAKEGERKKEIELIKSSEKFRELNKLFENDDFVIYTSLGKTN